MIPLAMVGTMLYCLYYYTTDPDEKTEFYVSFTMPAADVTIGAKFSFGTDIDEVAGIRASTYPNPIDDKLSVTCDEDIIGISLFTITGNVVFTETDILDDSFVADVSDLVSGTYILRIETNQGIVHRKIVKK